MDVEEGEVVIRLLSLGAGVQSTAIWRMSLHGELPKLDGAIFADTWWEPRAVYEHLKILRQEAIDHGVPLYIVSAGDMRDHVMDSIKTGKRVSSPPFFTMMENGKSAIINRSCTGDFKIDPIQRKVKELMGHVKGSRLPKDIRVEQWIGISGDEIQRMKRSTDPWMRFWHPLIELPWTDDHSHAPMREWSLTREDCQKWLVAHGYPPAPRSACIGCPFHSNAEWRDLRANDPEAFEDACQFDDGLRENGGYACDKLIHGMKNAVYLHRSLKPLRIAPIDEGDPRQGLFDFGSECAGVCGV